MVTLRSKGVRASRDTADQRRAILREFLRKHRIKPKELGRRGGFNPNSIYNFLKGVSDSLSVGTLERMVSAIPGATADDLLVLSNTQETTDRILEPSRVSSPHHPLREQRRSARRRQLGEQESGHGWRIFRRPWMQGPRPSQLAQRSPRQSSPLGPRSACPQKWWKSQFVVEPSRSAARRGERHHRRTDVPLRPTHRLLWLWLSPSRGGAGGWRGHAEPRSRLPNAPEP